VEIVEIDGTGRIYIPAEIRRRIKAKRFKLRLVEGGILLEPIDDIDIYYGRFGPANVEEIERALEDAVQVDLRRRQRPYSLPRTLNSAKAPESC